MIIDCEQCTAGPQACGDCVVSVLLGMPGLAAAAPHEGAALGPEQPAIPDEHLAAVSALADSGLVPPLRLVTPATFPAAPSLESWAG